MCELIFKLDQSTGPVKRHLGNVGLVAGNA